MVSKIFSSQCLKILFVLVEWGIWKSYMTRVFFNQYILYIMFKRIIIFVLLDFDSVYMTSQVNMSSKQILWKYHYSIFIKFIIILLIEIVIAKMFNSYFLKILFVLVEWGIWKLRVMRVFFYRYIIFIMFKRLLYFCYWISILYTWLVKLICLQSKYCESIITVSSLSSSSSYWLN